MSLDWDRIKTFYHVKQCGSFSDAAILLNLSQSAVSRQIGLLEEELNVLLFQRYYRGITLTEEGRLLFEVACEIYKKMAQAEALMHDASDAVQGMIKICTTSSFGNEWLIPQLKDFRKLYPNLRITLNYYNDSRNDVRIGEADVLLSSTPEQGVDLECIKFASYYARVYATQDYISQKGEPKTFEDLDDHDIIALSRDVRGPIDYQSFNRLLYLGRSPDNPRKPSMIVDDGTSFIAALSEGLVIGMMPQVMARRHRKLIPILTKLISKENGLEFNKYIIYPKSLSTSKRIQALVSFLKGRIKNLVA